MLDKNKTKSSDRQRPAYLEFPTFDELVARDKLIARCQYLFLRLLDVEEIGWVYCFKWHSEPLTWETVRDFDRGGLTLRYRTHDGDWRNVVIDDFTGVDKFTPKPIKLLSALRDVNASVAKGKRSDIIFRIGMTLAEAGANAHEIAYILSKSKCAQSKYGGNERRLEAEVERIMAKAKVSVWTRRKRGDDI